MEIGIFGVEWETPPDFAMPCASRRETWEQNIGRRVTGYDAMQASMHEEIRNEEHPSRSLVGEVVSRGRVAPVAVVDPCGFLAIFAAVFGATAATTLGKLPLELFPLATLVVSALADATSRFVLAAEVPHHHARPVLHVFGMVADGELFYQRKDVDIVGQQVLVLFLRVRNRGRRLGVVQQVHLPVDLEFGNKVGTLEIGPEVAVLGNVGQKLQGHQHVLVAGHQGHDILGGHASVPEVQGVGAGGESRRIRIVRGLSRRKTQSTVGLRSAIVVDDAAVHLGPVRDVEGLCFLALFRGISHSQTASGRDIVQHCRRLLIHTVNLHPIRQSNDGLGGLPQDIIVSHG